MKMTSRTLAPDVQNFFVGYRSSFSVLREACRKYPGLRHLIRAKNTLQYDNLLHIYMTVVQNTLGVRGTEIPWATMLAGRKYDPVVNYLKGEAKHSLWVVTPGDALPEDCLGLFLSDSGGFANSLIIAGELRILRWCNMRAVPTASTHKTASTGGVLLVCEEYGE